LPTLGEAIASPFAEAAERSSTMSKTGERQSGTRTERITLEVTHDLDARLSDWIVEVVDESLGLMESVRVVEEPKLAPHANAGGGSNHAKQAASGGGEHISSRENGYANGNESDRLGTGGVRCVGVGDGSVLGRDARGGVEVTQRPVAWLHEGLDSVFLFPNEELKLKCVPLYRQPPQPPKVVLTDFPPNTIRNLNPLYLAGWNQCMTLVKKSLAAAGVAVKEVGK
jgi:hypothetical protein